MSNMFLSVVLFSISGAVYCANCVKPDYMKVEIPKAGFTMISEDAIGCEFVENDTDINVAFVSDQKIYVKDCLLRGAGHWHTVLIGMSDSMSPMPLRGVRMSFSTTGWMTLRRFRKGGLPWLTDVNSDGKSEIVFWQSFSNANFTSSSSDGLIPFAYKIDGNELTLDKPLSCMMIREVYEKYQDQIVRQKKEYGQEWVYQPLYSMILKKLSGTMKNLCPNKK